MASAYSAVAFQQRIHTLLILRGIARLQRTCTVWAIATLAVLTFLTMLVTAGKQNEKSRCVSADFRPNISDSLWHSKQGGN
ncbi:hypothetical protein PQG02_32155 (plasmid) [Nostoc sp. UHCC 0926]|uniref:hypothetical protein n=1 Tax=Nostoc sp. UHCC 0926 TaxID=3025190 RepID=UPI00235FEAE6|nr:hypothetical protein [Nostoc sp. UHCC 0926]WDD36055.1 hypothetical protein PQG02_32155 [Nostoc sp. UHCC 0926]